MLHFVVEIYVKNVWQDFSTIASVAYLSSQTSLNSPLWQQKYLELQLRYEYLPYILKKPLFVFAVSYLDAR